MNKEAAINIFIKKHYKFLTDSDEYNRQIFKKLKKEFFIETYKIAGGVKDKEIADKLVRTIIQNLSVKKLEILQENINDSSFLKSCNIQAQDYDMLIRQLNDDYIDKEMLRNLSEDDKIEKLKEQFIKTREPELLEAIENIKRKKESLEKDLESILDDMEFNEPESYSVDLTTTEWWEDLGLTNDPFPTTNGFSSINEDLFEKIVVDTFPFQWLIKKIRESKFDFFNRGTLVGGALGTGKTTFFDFFKPKFISLRYEPIRIIIPEKIGIAHYNLDFDNQLLRKMKLIAKHHNLNAGQEDVQEIMLELQESKQIRGFILFFDDLHKHRNRNNVFDFLSNLQLYKNTFYDAGINAAFFISGLPEWRIQIERDQRLNSFFDGSQEVDMPEITPEQASQAISKRLSAYAKNKERKFPVSKKFLEYIFTAERDKRIIVGFRAYIDTAKKYFNNKQFDILGLSLNMIPENILSKIKTDLEANGYFKKSFNSLQFKGGMGGKGKVKSETLHGCLELLSHIYQSQYILENDLVSSDNSRIMLLKHLVNSQFVTKSIMSKGAWKIHSNMTSLNQTILQKYGYSLEDYLIQIYSNKVKSQSSKLIDEITEIDKQLSGIKNILETKHHKFLDRLVNEFHILAKYDPSEVALTFHLQNIGWSIDKIKEFVNSFATFLVEVESPSLFNVFGRNSEKTFSLRYRSLDKYPALLHLIEDFENSIIKDESMVARIVAKALDAFRELFQELERSLKLFYKLNKQPFIYFDKKMLHSLSHLIDSMNSSSIDENIFFDNIEKYLSNFEESFKSYLFLCSYLVFGDINNRFQNYPDILKNLKNFMYQYTGQESCYNEFSTLERSGFEKIFNNPSIRNVPFYKYIVSPINKSFSDRDLEIFCGLYIKFDQIISHREKLRIPEIRKNLNTFLDLSTQFLSSFNTHLYFMIFQDSFIYQNNGSIFITYLNRPRNKSNAPIETNDKYINNLPKDIVHHRIDSVLNEVNLFEGFFQDDLLEVNLSDTKEMLQIVPGKSYPLQLGVINYLIAIEKIQPTRVYGLTTYLKKLDTFNVNGKS
jgi:hypothetical protein